VWEYGIIVHREPTRSPVCIVALKIVGGFILRLVWPIGIIIVLRRVRLIELFIAVSPGSPLDESVQLIMGHAEMNTPVTGCSVSSLDGLNICINCIPIVFSHPVEVWFITGQITHRQKKKPEKY
jgi:hypothetical protein